MKIQEFINQIITEFGYQPTSDQLQALETFGRFLADRDMRSVMIMRGSAGTGKTSLAGAMVRTFHRLGQKLQLMAPTGRAAKVFARNCGLPAYTIHRRIYREKSYTGLNGDFSVNNNMYKNTLFMIDEASMCSSDLLPDLVNYVYSGDNCRMLLIGDKAQLPPVGEDEAPALDAEVLQYAGLRVYECDLNEVLRQSSASGILYNATVIRQMIVYGEPTELPKISFQGFADIKMVPGSELIEQLATSYSDVGIDETMVITRSNKRANIYNQGIRNSVLDREDELTPGDMLMIVKNNYYWIEREKKDNPNAPMTFIANGDRAEVVRVRHIIELYGFRFAEVLLRFPDYENYELETMIILDSLSTESPSLTQEQSEKLFEQIMEDYQEIPLKKDRLGKIREDKFFNALQVKFAYAITCHKAQGGQWSHIYVDQGYMTDEMLTPDYIHWLYTAFTRASEKLYLVNWPKQQTDGEIR